MLTFVSPPLVVLLSSILQEVAQVPHHRSWPVNLQKHLKSISLFAQYCAARYKGLLQKIIPAINIVNQNRETKLRIKTQNV